MISPGKYRHRLLRTGRFLSAALFVIFLLQGSLLCSPSDSPASSEHSITQFNILPGADQQQARNSAGKMQADVVQIAPGGPPPDELLSARLQFCGTPRVESLPSRLVYTLTTSSCL